MMIRLSLWKLAIVGASVLVAGQSTTTAFFVSPHLSPAKTNNNGRRTVSENPATATATLAVSSTDDDEDSSTYTKAPPVTADLYDESITTLYASNLIYTFTEMLDKARDGTLSLKIPDDFQEQDLSRFLTTSMNLTEYNDGNGIRFSEIYSILEYNSEELLTVFEDSMSRQVVANLRTIIAPFADNGKEIYLTFHRSIQQKVACVYSVLKDTISQRVMVSFRGSTTKVDWQTNLDARVVGMRTPTKIVPYITNKKYKTEVLVHRGFYDYLFDNDKIDGLQRYDQVCLDIQETLRGDAGYGVYITGHSLGAALATMFACKLAGAGSSYDDIPRPITCVSWAAPFSGTEGYRIVIENLERHGYLRSLRVTNSEDIVPAIPNISMSKIQPMKHGGINLRLYSNNKFRLEHSSKSGFRTALRNSLFKPIWNADEWHSLDLYQARFETLAAELKTKHLDEFYHDPQVVRQKFLDGTIE